MSGLPSYAGAKSNSHCRNQLDVLIGHPEYDLLFIATQVARLAGLKHPSQSVAHCRKKYQAGIQLQELQQNCISFDPETVSFGTRKDLVIFTESQTYQMLLRGHASASEPFRKWATGEVLPSIRKTGSYDIGTSKTPEAQQLSMDYGDLRALIENMAI